MSKKKKALRVRAKKGAKRRDAKKRVKEKLRSAPKKRATASAKKRKPRTPSARPSKAGNTSKPRPRSTPKSKPRSKPKKPAPRPKPKKPKRTAARPKPKKPAARPKPKKSTPRPKPAPSQKKRRAEDKALRTLLRELGEAKAAKRLGKSRKTIEQWGKRGVPRKRAADVVRALRRRSASKKSVQTKRQLRIERERWKERRREVLAQEDSPVTSAKGITGVELQDDGSLIGYGANGVLMRMYAIVNKQTGQRSFFWTTHKTMSGYSPAEFLDNYLEDDSTTYEVEFDFS
jgi:hypothetical protein